MAPETVQASDQRSPTGRTVAVILCAGQGTRMGGERNKVMLELAGKPIAVRAAEAFERTRQVDEMLLVAHPREVEEMRALAEMYGLRKVRQVIAGGATRHQSETNALNALRERIERDAVDIVLVHDGARPLVTPREIGRLIRVACEIGGGLLATPVEPAVSLVESDAQGDVATILSQGRLWKAQTPQAFEARALLSAYDAAAATGYEGTDTAASFERAGHTVRVVPGSPRNFKITTPSDLARADTLMRRHPTVYP